eukprot:TRINITY_DN959_c0_g1_i2.p1 TRINITY_DN959_c0_g1~~TRINITY_DN959_c0_g1_i2.p1  ORF type:complete len:689 (-),score=193.63 TRINITY_DN959_c0_g1_i2:51-2117(-)
MSNYNYQNNNKGNYNEDPFTNDNQLNEYQNNPNNNQYYNYGDNNNNNGNNDDNENQYLYGPQNRNQSNQNNNENNKKNDEKKDNKEEKKKEEKNNNKEEKKKNNEDDDEDNNNNNKKNKKNNDSNNEEGGNEKAKKAAKIFMGMMGIFMTAAAIGLAITVGLIVPKGRPNVAVIFEGNNTYKQQMLSAARFAKFDMGKLSKNNITFIDENNSTNVLNQFQKFYKKGIRVFVGPLLASNAELVLKWASVNATDAVIITPATVGTSANKYKNFFRLSASNTQKTLPYATLISEVVCAAQCRPATNIVIPVIRNDSSTFEFLSSLNQTASQVGISFSTPVYLPNVLSNTTADNFTAQISQLVATFQAQNLTVGIYLNIYENDTSFFLPSINNSANLKTVPWIADGFLLSGSFLNNTNAVAIARQIGLYGLQYNGGDSITPTKKKLIQNITSLIPGVSVSTDIFLAYDSILWISNTDYTKISNISYALAYQANQQYGLSGSLQVDSNNNTRSSQSFIRVRFAANEGGLGLNWIENGKMDVATMNGVSFASSRYATFQNFPANWFTGCTSGDLAIQFSDYTGVSRSVNLTLQTLQQSGVPFIPTAQGIQGNWTCNNKLVQIYCPPNTYGSQGSCVFQGTSLNTTSSCVPGIIDTAAVTPGSANIQKIKTSIDGSSNSTSCICAISSYFTFGFC